MHTTNPDQDENADTGGSNRPDDPAVLAAAAGKAVHEDSGKKPRQHLPSRQHNRGPPSRDGDDEVSALAGDVLLGAKNIAKHITDLGFPVDEGDIYYLHRSKKWPFGKYGTFLIASRKRLNRHAERLLRA